MGLLILFVQALWEKEKFVLIKIGKCGKLNKKNLFCVVMNMISIRSVKVWKESCKTTIKPLSWYKLQTNTYNT